MFDLSTPSFDEFDAACKETSPSIRDDQDVVSEYFMCASDSCSGDGYYITSISGALVNVCCCS